MSFDDFSDDKKEHYYDGEPHSFNNVWLGVGVAFIVPFITLLIILKATNAVSFTPLDGLIHFLLHYEGGRMTNMFVMSMMPLMFVFFYIYKSERWKLARGLVMGTLVYFCLFFMRSL